MGSQRDEYHFDDDELEDGRTVRVPLMLCDAVDAKWAFDARDHQPGYRSVTDDAKVEDARAARDEMIDRLTSAWRRPVHDAAQPDLGTPRTDPDADDPEAVRASAYGDYKAQLSNAWRSGGTVAAAAFRGPGPLSNAFLPAGPEHTAGSFGGTPRATRADLGR